MNRILSALQPPNLRVNILLLCGVGAVVASYLTLDKVRDISVLLFSINFLLIAAAFRIPAAKIIVYNCAFIFGALGLFELYSHYKSAPKSSYEGGYHTDGFFIPDADLGYAIKPRQNAELNSILRSSDGRLLYDVKYRVNPYGYRATPEATEKRSGAGLAFFLGDSFTFGEGVNDGETLPAAFARLTGAEVLNFGVPGYGPHHMLRQLEIGRVRKMEPRDPQTIVYTLLPTPHMNRAAGRAAWDQSGPPHYEPVGGVAEYVGKFEKYSPTSIRFLDAIVFRSAIYNAYFDGRFRNAIGDADRRRTLAILLKARELSRDDYHARFVVLQWDVNRMSDDNARWIADRLAENGVDSVHLSVLLPALQDDAYYIPVDSHPKGGTYALVAEALQRFLETSRN